MFFHGQHVADSSAEVPAKSFPGAPLYRTDLGQYFLLSKSGWNVVGKLIDGKPRVSDMPYLYDIAEGNVADHEIWTKIGFNPDVGTSEEDIWVVGGSYVAPSSAMQMRIISTSTSDSTAGSGIRSVIIYGLDGAGASTYEILGTGGTTAVQTVKTDWTFINGFRAYTCGTALSAAGNIDLYHASSAAPIYARIAQGYTRGRNSNYKVPPGKTLYVTSIVFSVYGATKGVRFTTRATYDPSRAEVIDFFMPFTEANMANGSFIRPLESPTPLPAGTRLKVSAVADAAGAVCSCALRGWME